MQTIRMYQVDAFTDRLFGGNPAAVCVLDKWPEDSIMQNIAFENNLAETAFVVKYAEEYHIRWFTPTIEVDLCGHATLASAYVLYKFYHELNEILFHSHRSGHLRVKKHNDLLVLDFPADELSSIDATESVYEAIGLKPKETWKGKTDYLAVLESEEQVKTLRPDLAKVSALKCRGLIVTAPGNEVDFVSRFFAPQSGIDEDPVTGSAHTTLTVYWSKKTGKTEFTARQISQRGGALRCIYKGSRVNIGGQARLYLAGEIYVADHTNS
jgi:PhzF family phenazine biosynthesis protein